MKGFILVVGIMFFFTAAAYTQGAGKPSKERGKLVYETSCLPCHQQNGMGVPGMNPPLAKTKWVLGDKGSLIDIILNGMKEPIEIDGEMYHNIMPAQPGLSDENIADVLTFVRNSFGNKASAVTVADVKKRRKLSPTQE